jgi:hypothetical protein
LSIAREKEDIGDLEQWLHHSHDCEKEMRVV